VRDSLHHLIARGQVIAYYEGMATGLRSDLGHNPAEVENRLRKALRLALAIAAAGGTEESLDPLATPAERVEEVKRDALRVTAWESASPQTWLAVREVLAEIDLWRTFAR
jgi:hypothetical protein